MKKLLLILFTLSLVSSVHSQDRITMQFRQILFSNLADTIEKRIPVKIYYADKWVDSLYIDVNTENESLSSFLGKSLAGKGFSFFISEDNKVILSKGYSIKTDFHREYLRYLERMRPAPSSENYARTIVEEDQARLNEEYKVFKIGNPSGSSEGNAVLTGIVHQSGTGEALAGVVVYIAKLKAGAVTNSAGYYSIEVPRGQYQVEYRMVGMRSTMRNIIIYSGGVLDVGMTEGTNQLNEVIVSANKENIVRNVRIGVEKIDVKMLKQIPMGMGEVDVFKSSLLLPGVTSVGEASGGYNIRGGSTDQNLILLNGAPIINPSHFFGFFSSFNSDMIEDVMLYKNGIPAKFGGRVSSVMDISLREGNREKFNVSGGISPLTGRLMVEGPVIRKKASFILSSRTTYSDWVLKMMNGEQLKRSSAGFYDVQGLLSMDVNPKNSFSVSGYLSNDRFDYYREDAISYSNLAATLKWRHVHSPRFSWTVVAIISNYGYRNISERDSLTDYSLKYSLHQKIGRTDFIFRPGDRHKVEFGFEGNSYSLSPGLKEPSGIYSETEPLYLAPEQALETSVYASDEFEISPAVTISGGLRFTLFSALGPGSSNVYDDSAPRSIWTITDTIIYGKSDAVKRYWGPEFRLSARFVLATDLSLKAGVQRNYQYLHMISNTTSMTPTDIWKLSDDFIRPQRGDQFSLGLYKNIRRQGLEASAEGYYKILQNILDYKGGAELLMNDHLETDIISGNGKAYGVELMLRKQTGMLTGWVSYTYSRVLLKVDGRFEEERINGGNYFPANYDKPNDLKFVANAKFFRRFNFTTNFTYSTGRPVTYPVAYYNFMNVNRLFFSGRNEIRIPDYMRLDLAATVNGNLRAHKLNHSSLTFTVYNVLGRRNPYSVFFRIEDGAVKGYRMSIFGQPVFMATYNFRILGNASTDF